MTAAPSIPGWVFLLAHDPGKAPIPPPPHEATSHPSKPSRNDKYAAQLRVTPQLPRAAPPLPHPAVPTHPWGRRHPKALPSPLSWAGGNNFPCSSPCAISWSRQTMGVNPALPDGFCPCTPQLPFALRMPQNHGACGPEPSCRAEGQDPLHPTASQAWPGSCKPTRQHPGAGGAAQLG